MGVGYLAAAVADERRFAPDGLANRAMATRGLAS